MIGRVGCFILHTFGKIFFSCAIRWSREIVGQNMRVIQFPSFALNIFPILFPQKLGARWHRCYNEMDQELCQLMYWYNFMYLVIKYLQKTNVLVWFHFYKIFRATQLNFHYSDKDSELPRWNFALVTALCEESTLMSCVSEYIIIFVL